MAPRRVSNAIMRLNIKPAAAVAGGAFLLLLILDLVWPGHGAWLLVFGLLVAAAAGAMWWRDRAQMLAGDRPTEPPPLSSVSAYGISGAGLQMHSRRVQGGVPLAFVLAPISALSILLFVGGAIGSGEPEVVAQVAPLEGEVSAIDRSRDGESSTLQVNPPATAQSAQTSPTTTAASTPPTPSTTESTQSQQASSAPVRPIVVSAPKTAAALEEEEAETAALEAIRTIEHTVEEGDSLYEIALEYDVTVEAIMDLNGLDANTYIHPGDVLRIPLSDEDEA